MEIVRDRDRVKAMSSDDRYLDCRRPQVIRLFFFELLSSHWCLTADTYGKLSDSVAESVPISCAFFDAGQLFFDESSSFKFSAIIPGLRPSVA